MDSELFITIWCYPTTRLVNPRFRRMWVSKSGAYVYRGGAKRPKLTMDVHRDHLLAWDLKLRANGELTTASRRQFDAEWKPLVVPTRASETDSKTP